MKQISIALNILLIAAITYASCRSKTVTPANLKNETGKATDCLTCDTTFEGVPAKDFVEVVARYRRTHSDVINTDVIEHKYMQNTYVDSRCVWFSLDTLKQFICSIERYSDLVGVNRNSLGIRFYYAVYPGNMSKDYGPEYAKRLGQHTIFMVPTTIVANEITDYDPLSTYKNKQLTGDSSITYLADALPTFYSTNSKIFALGSNPTQSKKPFSAESYTWNNGNLCPVNCPPKNTLASVDQIYPKGLPYK